MEEKDFYEKKRIARENGYENEDLFRIGNYSRWKSLIGNSNSNSSWSIEGCGISLIMGVYNKLCK